MRAVWILLTLLVVAGAASLWDTLGGWGERGSEKAALRNALDAAAEPRRESATTGISTSGPAPAAGAVETTLPPSAGSVVPARDHAAGAPAGASSGAAGGSGHAASLASELAASASERATVGDPSSSRAFPNGPRGTTAGPAPLPPLPPGTGEKVALGLNAELPSATVEPGSIIALPDGTLRADDRFIISGAGTPEDPYRVSWELLMSAAETYQPRQGLRAVPQRVALLNGKHVRIEGYAAFPAFSFDPTEMLMMLNRWDGCCIGVPPTPFDAIEVKLAEVPRENRRQVVYFGSVEGKLAVEPYVIDSWLIGLYLLSDGRFRLDL